jgi:hypothetical protein
MSQPTARQAIPRKYRAPFRAIQIDGFRKAHHRYLGKVNIQRRNFALAVQVRLGLAKSFRAAKAAFLQERTR